MNRTIQLALACAAVMFAVGQVQAELITFSFSGTVNSQSINIDPADSNDYSGIPDFIGEQVSGTYTFESTTPDDDVNANIGIYNSPGVTSGIVTVGSYSSAIINGGDILVYDVPGFNFYDSSGSSITGPSILGLEPNYFSVGLEDFSTSHLNNDGLPVIPPNPNAWESSWVILGFRDPTYSRTNLLLRASLDSLSLVESTVEATPEPTSLAIFGIGALCMGAGAARRRFKKANT